MVLATLALGLSGCGIGARPFPFALRGPEFLLMYGLVTAASLGLVHRLTQRQGGQARLGGGLVMGAVWLLGLVRLIQGMAAGRPVGWLVLALALVSLALLQVLSTGEVFHDSGSGSGTGDGGGGGGCGGGGCGGGCGG
jgi:hypothetical protein